MEQSYTPPSTPTPPTPPYGGGPGYGGPGFGGMNPGGVPPKNWLVESILVTLFCCLPFGIVGIINASSVNTKFAAGDYAGAQEASANAGKWTKIGFFVGLGVGVLYGILMLAGIGTGMMGAMQSR